jgi:hypothetical protein
MIIFSSTVHMLLFVGVKMEDWLMGPPFLIGDRVAHIPRYTDFICAAESHHFDAAPNRDPRRQNYAAPTKGLTAFP